MQSSFFSQMLFDSQLRSLRIVTASWIRSTGNADPGRCEKVDIRIAAPAVRSFPEGNLCC